MAEIRVRDASPQLIKQLEEVAIDLKESTLAGVLAKIFPRYADMKKRIAEQNAEIGKLSNELRTAQYRVSNVEYDLKEIIQEQKQFTGALIGYTGRLEKKLTTFARGTKRGKAPAGRRSPGKKIVPHKKRKK